MNILLWVVIAVSIALVCFAVAKQTGFKIPSLPDNKWVRRGIAVSVVFLLVALFFPNVVGTITANTISWAKDFDENYGKAPAKEPSHPSKATPASKSVKQNAVVRKGYRPQTRVVEVTATEDKFTEVKIPSGVKVSFDCPDNGLAKVFHRGAPQGIVYDCAQTLDLGENLHNFRIGFSSKTKVPVLVRARITYN